MQQQGSHAWQGLVRKGGRGKLELLTCCSGSHCHHESPSLGTCTFNLSVAINSISQGTGKAALCYKQGQTLLTRVVQRLDMTSYGILYLVHNMRLAAVNLQ